MATSRLVVFRSLGRIPLRPGGLRPSGHRTAAALSRLWICPSCSTRGFSAGRRFHVDPGRTSRRELDDAYPALDYFPARHIGPDEEETGLMLRALSPPADSLDRFVTEVIPPDVLSSRKLFPEPYREESDATRRAITEALPEHRVLEQGKLAAAGNALRKSFIGAGYHETLTPEVIKRNVLENPAWYTSYTPYQPEISQGRLESLLNFQTMVSDLTALPMSNASLLDEGTAAAEAMTLSMNVLSSSRAKRKGKTFVVSHLVHPQTIAVLHGRAEGFGIRIEQRDVNTDDFRGYIDGLGEDLVGVMVQYPDTKGGVHDFRALADLVHEKGALLSCATDLLALTLLAPPGEWGADIAFGNAQRLGVPMGFGGPHAAFFAVKEKHKRKMPGRLVGVSKDRLGHRALRLALQTREQHIRREKATSNVCTAQALLANMSAMYAVYHGPAGLKAISERMVRGARILQMAASSLGYGITTASPDADGRVLFDTVVVRQSGVAHSLRETAGKEGYDVRVLNDDEVGISVGETTTAGDLLVLIDVLRRCATTPDGEQADAAQLLKALLASTRDALALPAEHARTSAFLTHPVFNAHHSETEMLRYLHHLQSKDLSLVHSMIPLGSCTMKLNGSVEMALISLSGFSNIHPFAGPDQTEGYRRLIGALEQQLARITAMDAVSLQPNSGAQGEFAGLRAIRRYHEARGETRRDICLIPVSAHGTNPASAAMAGMRVVPIRCDAKTGNLDLGDLEAKCEKHAGELGAIMITYPSTFGVFEPQIKKVCEVVHGAGGQVYMDGANMNAQIGLCSPGEIGADVCHLNLHKTFCIPHGGGGPGVGPICVKEHLREHLPPTGLEANAAEPMVSSAPYGSAGILPISWAYNLLMGTLAPLERPWTPPTRH